MTKNPSVPPAALSILSGFLLFLSYPPFPFGFLAWIAFVPFFLALREAPSKGAAFFTGFGTGFVLFFVSLQWLSYVTAWGWVVSAAIEALFFGLFAVLIYGSLSLRAPEGRSNLVWIPLAWTATEFFRVKFPVLGFGWNLLGYSQASYPIIVQSANVVGVYGVGFAIMMVNAAAAAMVPGTAKPPVPGTLRDRSPKRPVPAVPGTITIGFIFLLLFSHGLYHQNRAGKKIGNYRIAVIQGNIPQSVKWEVIARDKILQIYTKLTELAAYEKPSLIIWPEAAFPGYFNRDADAQSIRDLARKLEIPLLVGAPHLETDDIAYNSAYLLATDGTIQQRYDKQNLVPFGEYVPLKWLLGGLTRYAYSLGVSDFSAGREKTVFNILNKEISFSVLICFEDIFPELSRQFVDRGADFLAVITNDAWFGTSGAAAQHLQASIFRAVENGVPVVRAANTGISAFISNRGQVLGRIQDKKGNPLFVAGYKTIEFPVEKKETLYRAGGWMFPYAASAAFVIMFALKNFKRRKTS